MPNIRLRARTSCPGPSRHRDVRYDAAAQRSRAAAAMAQLGHRQAGRCGVAGLRAPCPRSAAGSAGATACVGEIPIGPQSGNHRYRPRSGRHRLRRDQGTARRYGRLQSQLPRGLRLDPTHCLRSHGSPRPAGACPGILDMDARWGTTNATSSPDSQSSREQRSRGASELRGDGTTK